MRNLLLEQIEYKIDETPLGTWRRFMYAEGSLFQEFVSHQRFFGLPSSITRTANPPKPGVGS